MLSREQYRKTVTRPYPVLQSSLFLLGFSDKKTFSDFFSEPIALTEIIVVDNAWYCSDKQLSLIGQKTFEAWKSGDKFKRHRELFLKKEERLKRASLGKSIKVYAQAFSEYMSAVLMISYSQDHIEKYVQKILSDAYGEESANEYLDRLNLPLEDNIYKKEEYELVTTTNIVDHVKRYKPLYSRYGSEEAYTLNEAREKLSKIDKMAYVQEYNLKKKSLSQYIVDSKVKLHKDVRHMIDVFQFMVYYRTHRADIIHWTAYQAIGMFTEFGTQRGLSYKQVLGLTINEILNDSILSIGQISQRLEKYGMLMEGGVIQIFTGDKDRKLIELFQDSLLQINDFSGHVVYKGNVRGRVFIVHGPAEYRSIPKNVIMVTSMTTPDIVPYLDRASAIITDEGGVTCHAAIISRELKKPCIIGTKIATKVLKDGDEVEVDADKGVVKVLKKSSSQKEYVLINQDVDTSMLTLEMTWAGMDTKHYAMQTGYNLPLITEMVNGTTINAYMPKEEFERGAPICARVLLTKPEVRSEIVMQTERTTQEIQEYALSVKDKIEIVSHEELAGILTQIRILQAHAVEWGTVIVFADIFGEISNAGAEVLSNKDLPFHAHICSHILSHPQNGTLTEQAVEDIRSSALSDNQLLEKYFWLEQGYIGRGLTQPQLEEIRLHQHVEEENKMERLALIALLQLTDEEILVFDVARDLIYNKSLRADSRQFLHVVINRIVDRLAVEFDIESRLLETLTTFELAALLRGEAKLPSDLQSRYERSVFIPTEPGEYKLLLGNDAVEYVRDRVYVEEIEEVVEITGQIAHQGKVRGLVKLVFGPQHNTKVQVGDILVSYATSPQLLPAMKRAAAIVTNVGGITSHAAIVSRELKTPCIVGTKIATKVLKDGDEVEVDADKGVVRIIKRNTAK